MSKLYMNEDNIETMILHHRLVVIVNRDDNTHYATEEDGKLSLKTELRQASWFTSMEDAEVFRQKMGLTNEDSVIRMFKEDYRLYLWKPVKESRLTGE